MANLKKKSGQFSKHDCKRHRPYPPSKCRLQAAHLTSQRPFVRHPSTVFHIHFLASKAKQIKSSGLNPPSFLRDVWVALDTHPCEAEVVHANLGKQLQSKGLLHSPTSYNATGFSCLLCLIETFHGCSSWLGLGARRSRPKIPRCCHPGSQVWLSAHSTSAIAVVKNTTMIARFISFVSILPNALQPAPCNLSASRHAARISSTWPQEKPCVRLDRLRFRHAWSQPCHLDAVSHLPAASCESLGSHRRSGIKVWQNLIRTAISLHLWHPLAVTKHALA